MKKLNCKLGDTFGNWTVVELKAAEVVQLVLEVL